MLYSHISMLNHSPTVIDFMTTTNPDNVLVAYKTHLPQDILAIVIAYSWYADVYTLYLYLEM